LADPIHTFSHIASFGMLKVREERRSDSKLARGVETNGCASPCIYLMLTARDFCLILDSF
jgi:hypothetical protein